MVKSKKVLIESTVIYNRKEVLDDLFSFGLEPTEYDYDADVCLAIGGDSAVLKASKNDLPILAWNKGTLGYLTTGRSLRAMLKSYVDKTLYIDSRRRLEVTIDLKKHYVLNEIAVVGEETGRLVETDMFIDDRKICTFKGDGLIVSTPTGSTAWSLSCGGSLVEHGVKCMLLTPSNPFTMNVRPLIIDSDHTVLLEKVQKVVLDGYTIVQPRVGTIIIQYDNRSVHIYRQREENFFDGLEKLGWNENIKK
jgi:NAD+ kinase